jgi:hypothetical protein
MRLTGFYISANIDINYLSWGIAWREENKIIHQSNDPVLGGRTLLQTVVLKVHDLILIATSGAPIQHVYKMKNFGCPPPPMDRSPTHGPQQLRHHAVRGR